MAKGDNLVPGLGWNPGGMRMGGIATFGTPRPQMQGVAPQMQQGNQQNGSIGPSSSIGNSFGNIGEMKQSMQNMGMNPPQEQQQEQGGVAPQFNFQDVISRMMNGGSNNRLLGGAPRQGTPTTPPMQPNSYALNPSANLFKPRNPNQI